MAKACTVFWDLFMPAPSYNDRPDSQDCKSGLLILTLFIPRREVAAQECIQHEPCTQPEAGDEAVQGVVAVVGGSGVGKVREAFLLLTGEMLGQPLLVLADRPQLAPDARVILESAVLRVNIAVIEPLDKALHIVSPSLF